MKKLAGWGLFLICFILPMTAFSIPVIYINQVAFDSRGGKTAVIGTGSPLSDGERNFQLTDQATGRIVFKGKLSAAERVKEWRPAEIFYAADFSTFSQPGSYRLSVTVKNKVYRSEQFAVADNALAVLTIPSVLHYYRKQRANTPAEWEADAHVKLAGSDSTADMRGGWCDASGDVSKYFSHLAYANFVSPQQIPLVTWSLAGTAEAIPGLLDQLGMKDSITGEAIWGADYLMRALSPQDYFRMIVFSFFNKDPSARKVVGLLADSKTTSDYQAAFREGGGMAIAALARIARWKKDGAFTSGQYLDGAKRAFAHLLVNNHKYDDDGKENIIDDYCALIAATELWKTTGDSLYRFVARQRAQHLEKRLDPAGYFIADDGSRPFWHAADAGMPVIALARYLKMEDGAPERAAATEVIKKALEYNLRVTGNVSNPFGYARQSFRFRGQVKDGFFIPHENETGWWWQGEDARLASLAAAAIVGGRVTAPKTTGWGVSDSLARYASQQISWILGGNPYSMCFMYQFGKNNVPYMHSNFGHGSEKGGISNGITGGDGNPDGSGIDFKKEAEGNEWRWTEQWIPHAAWYLQAVTAMAESTDNPGR